jgi:hypothetical protein
MPESPGTGISSGEQGQTTTTEAERPDVNGRGRKLFKRNALPLKGILSPQQRADIRELALSKVTKIMSESAPAAAHSLRDLAVNAMDERARYSAASKIVDWISPPPSAAALVQINNQIGIQSHLGIPLPPQPSEKSSERLVTSRPELPAAPSILPELASGAGEIEAEPVRGRHFPAGTATATEVTADRLVIPPVKAIVRQANLRGGDEIYGRDFTK